MATLVTFEQENLFSPITLSFRTIQRISVGKGISLLDNFPRDRMALWRDYLIGTYGRAQHRTCGLFLWNVTENSIFYFEVCHSFFPSPGSLNPNSRQMEFFPQCINVVDDVLFVGLISTRRHFTYCYIHIPSLVISTPLLGGFLSLAENAVFALPPKYSYRGASSNLVGQPKIYPIPASSPTHPRYCFVIKRCMSQCLGSFRGVEWEVFEVEVDLRTPGPIKIFSRVSSQYRAQRPTYPLHDSDDDLFLYLPSRWGSRPDHGPPSVRFLRVGKPDTWRVVRFLGDKMRREGLRVDRDAGYVIIWGREPWGRSTRECCFIWWSVNVRKPGNMARTKEWISNWSRGLLRRF